MSTLWLIVTAVLSSAATTEVDTFGGSSMSSEGSFAYKINTFDATWYGRLQTIEMELDPSAGFTGGDKEVTYVVYENTGGNQWTLLAEDTQQINGGVDWYSSDVLNIDILPGRSYGMGVVLGAETVGYDWGDTGPQVALWGERTGSLWSFTGEAFSVPGNINDGISTHGYRQRLTVEVYEDLDSDGFPEILDCDDGNDQVNPGADEICDGLDNDCNGQVDDVTGIEMWPDLDGDGFGDGSVDPVTDCSEATATATNGDDCDDANAEVYPGADEICDGVDNNCDSTLRPDEGDLDLDGAADCLDCAPTDPDIFPGNEDPCNGVDNDCDGVIPPDDSCDPYLAEEIVAAGCGCVASGASGPAPWTLAGLTVLLGLRRRRLD